MARSIRIEYPGAFYHVMARGNRRDAIYWDDDDRRYFLNVLSEASGKTGWRVHAWVLMSNHYHLVLETPEANLVEGMKWVQNTYTRRFNVRHGVWGRLFGDRYKSILVEAGGTYYQTLLDYIHLNPARAKLVNPEKRQSVLDYAWSSVAGGYSLPSKKRAKWLAAEDGLAAFGLPDTLAGRRKFVERLDRRVVAEGTERAGVPVMDSELDARSSHLRRGWYWGSEQFAEKMLKLGQKLMETKRHRSYRSSQEIQAHGQNEAEKILYEGLHVTGLSKRDLKRLPGSDVRKVAIAEKIWGNTTVSMGWISDRLAMKSAANASQQIRRMRTRKRFASQIPEVVKLWRNQSRYVA